MNKIGRHRADGKSYIMPETPYKLDRADPILGQDNEFVYGSILGLSEAEISQCYVDGVFE
jgi:hypothetical protein